jgi:hypothetical protein
MKIANLWKQKKHMHCSGTYETTPSDGSFDFSFKKSGATNSKSRQPWLSSCQVACSMTDHMIGNI